MTGRAGTEPGPRDADVSLASSAAPATASQSPHSRRSAHSGGKKNNGGAWLRRSRPARARTVEGVERGTRSTGPLLRAGPGPGYARFALFVGVRCSLCASVCAGVPSGAAAEAQVRQPDRDVRVTPRRAPHAARFHRAEGRNCCCEPLPGAAGAEQQCVAYPRGQLARRSQRGCCAPQAPAPRARALRQRSRKCCRIVRPSRSWSAKASCQASTSRRRSPTPLRSWSAR